jgi:hypothetical protein
MDIDEMRVFDLALRGLIAKAGETGSLLSSEEIARRMLLVQEAKVYDPDEFAKCVLAENFEKFERCNRQRRARSELVDLGISDAARRILERA